MKILSYLTLAALCLCSPTISARDCEISLSVLPMTQGEDVPEPTQDYLLTHLSRMLTADGVMVDAGQAQFFVSAKFNHITEDVTPGPPTQTALHSYLTLYMGDLASETVYATTTLELRGVGTSQQRAFINAMRSVNANNRQVASFIENGKAKIINYFDKNYKLIINKARRAAEKNDFEQALWLLVSVPDCCIGYDEVYALETSYFQAYIDQLGVRLYSEALACWAASPDQAGAEKAFRYLMLIDPESSAYPKAVALAAEIKASVKSDRDFELREKYHDSIDIEKRRIEAIRAIGVAYGKGQQPTTTNLMWVK